MITTTDTLEQRLDAAQRLHELPRAAFADRLALTLGLQLLLRQERSLRRRDDRAARAELARRSGAGARAADDRRSTFEHRTWAGPTW